ncbi:hypothetical protein N7513_007125 [Penicillium frequentans]|nr:hypothetical protein N7513_007125 [Penicillium glabrum]
MASLKSRILNFSSLAVRLALTGPVPGVPTVPSTALVFSSCSVVGTTVQVSYGEIAQTAGGDDCASVAKKFDVNGRLDYPSGMLLGVNVLIDPKLAVHDV